MKSANKNIQNPIVASKQCKGKANKEALKEHLIQNRYVQMEDREELCKAFQVEYHPKLQLFGQAYKQAFYNYLSDKVETVASASKVTGIPQKYLTICKLYYEKRDLLKVVYKDTCPTTHSKNVQFVTTDSTKWESVKAENQLNLF